MESMSQEISSTSDKPKIDKVVQAWIIDYYFATLCRLFMERDHDEFRKTLKIFEVLVDDLDSCPDRSNLPTQRTICCFLTRVMDGERLNTRYDNGANITPLMSALSIWESLKECADSALHSKIQTLLMVQSVAVCVKCGNEKLANKTLKWLEEQNELPERLQRRLASIVKKNDSYKHSLANADLEKLKGNIDSFLEAYNQHASSVFLIEAASKVVQAHFEKTEKTSEPSADMSYSIESIKQVHTRKLFSKGVDEPWKPFSEKKQKLSQMNVYKISSTSTPPSELESNISVSRQQRRKWTYEEDLQLKAGVKKFGVGNWKPILLHFDFGKRTSVNLKDRWRTLKKHGVVD